MKTGTKKLKLENKVGTPTKNFSNTNSIIWNSKRRYRL